MVLTDKVAWVTGAASGIGAAIAQGLLRGGAKVVLSDLDVRKARDVAVGSGISNDYWIVQLVDVANHLSVETCVDAIRQRFGGLDICVANAGITIRKPFLELTDSDFDRVMAVNARGVFSCSQAAAREMVQRGGGAILHIASQTSINARVNLTAYGASKGAVASLTRQMALELGPYQVRVNAICPGTIRTELTRERLSDPNQLRVDESRTMLGRIGEASDVVGIALLLVSDDAAFITGASVYVDGGETAW